VKSGSLIGLLSLIEDEGEERQAIKDIYKRLVGVRVRMRQV
jgi:hypothetical protein